jgi:hypothetical protein
MTWNINTWLSDMLPIPHRKVRVVSLLYALLKPFQDLYTSFSIQQGIWRKEGSLNGTAFQLERALNDAFDPDIRAIQVKDPNTLLVGYPMWLIVEGQPSQPVWPLSEIPPGTSVPIYEVEDYANQVDFIVEYPPTGPYPNVGWTAIVERYKLASRRYTFMPA